MKIRNEVKLSFFFAVLMAFIVTLGAQDAKKIVTSYGSEQDCEVVVVRIEAYDAKTLEAKANELREQGWEVRAAESRRDPRLGYVPEPRHCYEARMAFSLPI